MCESKTLSTVFSRTNSTFQNIIGTVHTIFDIPLVFVAEVESYALTPVDLNIWVG